MTRAWNGISAWTATLLFAFQPIGQLLSNFAYPSSLAGLSVSTILLAMVGNGMMVPRALHTRDKIWLTGYLKIDLFFKWIPFRDALEFVDDGMGSAFVLIQGEFLDGVRVLLFRDLNETQVGVFEWLSLLFLYNLCRHVFFRCFHHGS